MKSWSGLLFLLVTRILVLKDVTARRLDARKNIENAMGQETNVINIASVKTAQTYDLFLF